MRQKGLQVEVERSYEVVFRRRKLEWKRLQSNDEYFDIEEILENSMQL